MRNTDNTPGQMEATASTAKGKKSRYNVVVGIPEWLKDMKTPQPKYEGEYFGIKVYSVDCLGNNIVLL